MSANFEFPDDQGFFEKRFGYSHKYNNDEGVVSYVREYGLAQKLIFTILPYGHESSVVVEIIERDSTIAAVMQNQVTSVDFQAWGDEQAIRVYFDDEDNADLIVYFAPRPRIFRGDLSHLKDI